jgi:hypothetical protein
MKGAEIAVDTILFMIDRLTNPRLFDNHCRFRFYYTSKCSPTRENLNDISLHIP